MKLDEELSSKIKLLIRSRFEVKCRVSDLVTGDVAYSNVSPYPLYVVVSKGYSYLYIITKTEYGRYRVSESRGSTYVYGSKCQMWVIKKLLKPIKSNYQTNQ